MAELLEFLRYPSHFSKWKLLVGCSFSLGKIGVMGVYFFKETLRSDVVRVAITEGISGL